MSYGGRTAILAIHGVANQEPGDTARAVAAVLHARERGKGSEERWEARVPSLPAPEARGPLAEEIEPSSDGGGAPFRTLVVHDVPVSSERVVDVHEIAWADLSRPGTSPTAVLAALATLVLGLPSIGLRELRAAGLSARLAEHLERASRLVKRGMLPGVIAGIVFTFSLVALPCSRDRLETIRLVMAVAHGVLLPPAAAWFLTRKLQPTLDDAGRQRRWSVGVWLLLLGAAVAALCLWLPDLAFSTLPAVEVVAIGAVLGGLGIEAVLSSPEDRRAAVRVLRASCVIWLGLVVMNSLTAERGDAPSQAIAIARNVVYAVLYAIEAVYFFTSVVFAMASLFAIVALLPWAGPIVGARESNRTHVHALRTIAMSHALPFVLFVFLVLPLVSAVLAFLTSNDLLPNTRVSPQILTSLVRFADEGPVCEPMHVRHVLTALVRAAGTHLLVVVLAASLWVCGIVVFVVTPVVRVELGLLEDPDDAEEQHLPPGHRQRDVLARWLERGTFVVFDWIRNGSLLIACIFLFGFFLEVGVWLGDHVGLARSLVMPIRDGWRAARQLGAARTHDDDLWDALAHLSGRLVIGMGGALAGSTALLALPGRVRTLTQPLWPVLDVILDVTRYLDRDRRTRILARAHGVLEHLVAEGYDEIVVVAHSQGTLIAADLLRMTRAQRPRGPSIRLVTLGSPLANLYHRLLPGSFAWVKNAVEDPSYLGIEAWTNLYGGGDAVGRTVRDTELLRLQRGLSSDPRPGHTDPSDRANWIEETNVGSLGHVHYFSPDIRPAALIRERLRAAVLASLKAP